MIWLVIFSFFNFIAIAPKSVSAEVPYCCVQTEEDDNGNREYCVSSEDSDDFGELQCDGTPVYGSNCADANAPQDCALETCIPILGDSCLSNYPKVKCLNEGGVSDPGNKENIAECRLGCCDLGGSCTIVEQNECLGSHDSGITNQVSCSLSCSPSQLGCCEMVGSCSFTNLGDCNINDPSVVFHQDRNCNEVTSCAARADSNSYLGCGDSGLEQHSEHSVYWYDSEGNRESIPTSGVNYVGPSGDIISTGDGACGYPDYTCEDPDGLGVGQGAYCKSTACLLEGDCTNCNPTEFLHGETICLNPWGGHFTNEARSKEIKGFVLECNSGQIVEPTDVFSRSDFVCVNGEKTFNDITRKTARKISNEYEKCLDCGDGGWSILDTISYVPGFGGLIQGTFGLLGFDDLVCTSGSGWDILGADFTGTKCEDVGKTSDGIQMCEYDHDFYAPIGSCNPVSPPEGNRCDLCGKGGDKYTNICTMEECNVLGDCTFEPQTVNIESALAAGALSFGTAVSIYTGWWVGCKAASALGFTGCEAPPSWATPAELWYGTDKVALSVFGLDVTTSAIYWMIFGLVVDITGELTNEEEQYVSILADEDGSINLARALTVVNTVSTESGIEYHWIWKRLLGSLSAEVFNPNLIGELMLSAKLHKIYENIITRAIEEGYGQMGYLFVGQPCNAACANAMAEEVVNAAAEQGIEISHETALEGFKEIATFHGTPATPLIPEIPAIPGTSALGEFTDASGNIITSNTPETTVTWTETIPADPATSTPALGNLVDADGTVLSSDVAQTTVTWTETTPAVAGTSAVPEVPAADAIAPGADSISDAAETAADASADVADDAVKSQLGTWTKHILRTVGAIIHVVSTANSLKPGKCVAETPYVGNEKCENCGGAEGQWYCSQERCDVLGAVNNQCKYLQGEGFEDSKCVSLDHSDVNPPQITRISAQLFDSLGDYVETKEVTSNSLKVSTSYNWPDLNSIYLEIQTDEDAKCKYSKQSNSDFDMMDSLDFEGGIHYSLTHNTNITFTEFDKTGGDVVIYLKCEDINGNVHTAGDDFNTVEFSFGERPDELPPEVIVKSPSNGAFLPDTVSTIDWVLNVYDNNDISGCRYTQDNSTLYSDMEYDFEYKGSTSCAGTNYGCQEYDASVILEDYESLNITQLVDYGAGSLNYNFYFSCIDGSGNDNNPPYGYAFNIVPGFDVNITSPVNGSEIYEISPEIVVETSTSASCSYEIDGVEYDFEYGDSLLTNLHSIFHSGNLTGSPAGVSHILTVGCNDLAYNEATDQIVFEVIQDLVSPNLVRLYTYNGKLWLVLDEESSCSFTTLENDQPVDMVSMYGEDKYFTDLIDGVDLYYITCEDVWENEASFTIYP